MALNDLTPQLRTRLSRMERAVGWFVLLATALLVFGFVYYLVKTAERKGWFIKKIQYMTFVQSAEGLKKGDPVKLMGDDAGQIIKVVPNEPYDYYNITVYFEIKDPNQGYLWSDSKAKVVSDFLNHRYLEVTKGKFGVPTILETNSIPGDSKSKKIPIGFLKHDYVKQLQKELTEQINAAILATNGTASRDDVYDDVMQELNTRAWAEKTRWEFYSPFTDNAVCILDPAESPALSERLEAVVSAVEKALPDFLALTNTLTRALTNLAQVTAHADDILVNLKPTVSNLAVITGNIRDPHGSLGEWLITTNLNQQLTNTLSAATGTLNSAHTNLDTVATNVTAALENLSNITSNLNSQVQANSNILTSISSAVVHADEFVQGLKRHWLLRSAFKSKTTSPSSTTPVEKLSSPKGKY